MIISIINLKRLGGVCQHYFRFFLKYSFLARKSGFLSLPQSKKTAMIDNGSLFCTSVENPANQSAGSLLAVGKKFGATTNRGVKSQPRQYYPKLRIFVIMVYILEEPKVKLV